MVVGISRASQDTPPEKSLPALEVLSMLAACISDRVMVMVVGGGWGLCVRVVGV